MHSLRAPKDSGRGHPFLPALTCPVALGTSAWCRPRGWRRPSPAESPPQRGWTDPWHLQKTAELTSGATVHSGRPDAHWPPPPELPRHSGWGTAVKHTQLVCGLCPQISRLCQSTPELSGQRCALPSHVGHSRNGAFAQSLGAYCVLSVAWVTRQGDPCPALISRPRLQEMRLVCQRLSGSRGASPRPSGM